MDEVVELERIDLATVMSRESVADALEQLAQLLLVVFADDLACGPPPRALCASTSVRVVTAHGPHATPKSTIVATSTCGYRPRLGSDVGIRRTGWPSRAHRRTAPSHQPPQQGDALALECDGVYAYTAHGRTSRRRRESGQALTARGLHFAHGDARPEDQVGG